MENNDLVNMIYSLAIPSIKVLLIEIANKLNMDILDNINNLSINEDNIGSYKVDFEKESKKETLYILLKTCTKDHDLSCQFNKIQPYISQSQWDQLLKYISSLVFLVRTIYTAECTKLGITHTYNTLNVDNTNTTLYINDIDTRIGIFVESHQNDKN